MKKSFFIVLMFLYAFPALIFPAYAASSSSASSAGLIPVQECGYADYEPPRNKCCASDLQMDIEIPPTGSLLVDIVATAVNGMVDTVVNKVFLPIVNGVKNKVSSTPCYDDGVPTLPNEPQNPSCVCVKSAWPLRSIEAMCDPISSGSEKARCQSCTTSGNIWTSIGCVDSDLDEFIQKTILGWGLGLAGGVSLLCIIYAAFTMQTSGGNAEKVKKAQQLLTACITGLMFIIFSVLILRIIGVDILRIPGLH